MTTFPGDQSHPAGGAVGEPAVTSSAPSESGDLVRRRQPLDFDQDRYDRELIDEWYRRNEQDIESHDEQAVISANLDNDHLAACLWSVQQATRRLNAALRERR
jgi:hypothetical protein